MARPQTYRTLLAMTILALGLAFTVQTANAATFNIINLDGAGEGFNDPTPVAPVGGNPGTTLGQQRLNCFIRAGQIWGAILSSNVTISIDANMDPMFCNATSAVLGSAGPNTVHRNYAGAPMTNTWYVQAEANSHAGVDLSGSSDGGMTFNSNLNGDPGCLGGLGWYYGFDESPPGGDIDFVTVLVHEMGHVLGFLTLMSSDGSLFLSTHDTYERLMYHDGAVPPDYPSMTNAQRAAGNIGDPNLVFDGFYTNQEALAIPLTSGMTNGRVRLHGPNPYQGGSSLSHFSTAVFPNQIMEPSYTGPDHTPELDPQLMKDIGWTLITAPPVCSVDPSTIDFGTVTVGSSKDTTFTIENTGGGTLSGTVSESCPHYDIISGGGPYSLGAGQSVVVTLRFEPTSSGVKPCTVETGDALCTDVTCTGIGEDPPACSVDPSTIDFGTVTVASSKDTTFTIENTGGGTLSGTVSESCPDYDIISGGGPYSLSAGQSVVVTLRFEPTSSGVKPCTVETGDALCTDVTCTGIGEDPAACTVDPSTIDFGTVTVGSSKDTTFTIENTGGGIISGTVSESCPDYDIISGGGSYVLTAGQSVVVTLRFEPTSSGVKPCVVETGDALCTDVTCTGTGDDPPACVVNPTTIDFDTVTVGSSKDTTFTIENTGGGTLSGTVSESCPDYDIISGGGPYSLSAGQSVVVTLRFEPTSEGEKPCTVETGDALCTDVSCTGVGDDPLSGAGTTGPLAFALDQNHPNPFNPTTRIRFSLDRESMVRLIIYDVSGTQVRTLVNRHMGAGVYTEEWDARDNQGRPVASGIYFYRLSAGKRTLTRKAVLLR